MKVFFLFLLIIPTIGQAGFYQCSDLFVENVRAVSVLRSWIKTTNRHERWALSREVFHPKDEKALEVFLSPDNEQVMPLSPDKIVYYSLVPFIRSFRLDPKDHKKTALGVHLVYREAWTLGRISGPRYVLTQAILGPYQLNALNSPVETFKIENRDLIEILHQWSRRRDADHATVGYRESGL